MCVSSSSGGDEGQCSVKRRVAAGLGLRDAEAGRCFPMAGDGRAPGASDDDGVAEPGRGPRENG